MDEFFFPWNGRRRRRGSSFSFFQPNAVERSGAGLFNCQLVTALEASESTRARREGRKASRRGLEREPRSRSEAKLARRVLTRESKLLSTNSSSKFYRLQPRLSLSLLSLAIMVNVDANLIIKVLCCIFLPPLGVFLVSEEEGKREKMRGSLSFERQCPPDDERCSLCSVIPRSASPI